MSITVTIEELKAYQLAMDEWFTKRLYFESTVIEQGIPVHKISFTKPLDEWIKENPMPKLIPPV